MKFFKNFKIKQKLLVAFLIVALVGCTSSVLSSIMMHSITTTYDETLVNHGFAQGHLGKALAVFWRIDGNVHDAVSYQDKDYTQNALNNVKSLPAEFEEHMAAVKPTLKSDRAKQDYENVMKAWNAYKGLAQSIAEDGAATHNPSKIGMLQQRMAKELDPLCQTAFDGLMEMMNSKVGAAQTERDQADRMAALSLVIAVVLIVTALAVSMVFGVVIANSISKPMNRCCTRLNQLSEGDLQTPVPVVDSNDEAGQLTAATASIVGTLNTVIGDISYLLGEMAEGNFNLHTRQEGAYHGDMHVILESVRKINQTLSGSLARINLSAEQVAEGAEQVATGAQALAQGATEQASAVEELSATITDIENGARKNAEACQQAIDHSNLASGQVDESSRSMRQMVDAMGDIHEASVQIGKIIATIENIAFQTNILALNAAVEAARAGTAGKGFAVVADEVRNLAVKSDEAAKATKVLIENAITAVQKGENHLNGVSTALDATVQYAGQVIQDIQTIAVSAGEQSEAIAQVTEGINQISSVVQNNSATSEESAAASEELSGQAVIMKEEMKRFSLRESREGAQNSVPSAPAPSRSDAGPVADVPDWAAEETPDASASSLPYNAGDIFEKY